MCIRDRSRVLGHQRRQRRAEEDFSEAAGAELVALDVLDPDSIASAMAGASAVVCCTGFTPSLNFKKDNPAKVDHVGTDNLVAAAVAEKGVKRFVLVTSLLTNAKAAGQADNDNYKFLNALGGVLDEKLAAELEASYKEPVRWEDPWVYRPTEEYVPDRVEVDPVPECLKELFDEAKNPCDMPSAY